MKDHAHEVIHRHSRSFSMASRLLPSRIRTSVYAMYAWCRTVDDAVDEAVSCVEAERVLDVLESDLDRIRCGQSPLHPASVWIEPLITERCIELVHAKELITGMRMDVQSYRVTNDHDLNRYCYHVAGTVGLMMTRLMGVKDTAADRHAIALGMAMQMTNIARDVLEDAERGRNYLPGVRDPRSDDPQAVRAAVVSVLAKAARHYEVAWDGVEHLPRDCRFAIRMALSLYREIGRQIERNDYQVLQGRTVISKARLLYVLSTSLIESVKEDCKLAIHSITQKFSEAPMNDTKPTQVSTVAEAKHAVYLGLSLTAIMASALFVMVFVNPKEAAYSYLPLIYSGASLVIAVVFNRLAARCEINAPTPEN